MYGQKSCTEHGKDITSRCQWCAKPICDECIKEADGFKLCTNCAVKLAHEKPLLRRRREQDVIRNIDETLTEEQLLQAKERLQPPKKKRPKIRNEPDDWPTLQE